MPRSSESHAANDYADRIRARLPLRLQELREAAGLSKYGMARESGLSREYIGKLECGVANPTIPSPEREFMTGSNSEAGSAVSPLP